MDEQRVFFIPIRTAAAPCPDIYRKWPRGGSRTCGGRAAGIMWDAGRGDRLWTEILERKRMEALLELKRISREFTVRRGMFDPRPARVNAVNDVSLELMPGETLGL